MAKIYGMEDVRPDALKTKKVAVIGYGSQGRAQARNLRDSGIDVIVAQRPGGANWGLAREHGFEPVSAAEAARAADVVQVLVGDEDQPAVFRDEIGPNLRPGSALMFSHGFNVHFGRIEPPPEVDVVMVAPKGVGPMVRREFEAGRGVPCLVAVERDVTGRALATALAYAAAIGGARAGIIETTFAEETETDLFGEQAVLCGGAAALVKAGFETLVDAGYQPEVAYFECLHELKLIVDLMHSGGLTLMRRSISDTAEYGDLTRGPRVVSDETRREMRRILEEIRSGEFAREWISENEAGRPLFHELEARDREHRIEEVGRRLRGLMKMTAEDDDEKRPREG